MNHEDAADQSHGLSQTSSSLAFCHGPASKKKKGRRKRQLASPVKEGSETKEGNVSAATSFKSKITR